MQKSMQLSSQPTEHTHEQRGRVEGSTIKSPQTVASIIPSVSALLQCLSTLYTVLMHRTCVKGYVEVGL